MLRSVLDPMHRRTVLTGVIIIVVLLLGGWWWYGHQTTSNALLPLEARASQSFGEPPDPAESAQATTAPLGVDVIGAVQQPGLYFLPPGSRIQDAVQVAGGLTPNANREAINMSAHVADGQQLRVPRVGEALTSTSVSTNTSGTKPGTHININTADRAALATLSGIGPVLAQRIIDYRTAHGPFSATSDLHNVTGLHAGLFEKIKDRIQVSDAP